MDQSEFHKSRPVPLEQLDEFLLAPRLHSISTNDDRIICLDHEEYLAFLLNDDQELQLRGLAHLRAAQEARYQGGRSSNRAPRPARKASRAFAMRWRNSGWCSRR